jgi:hypothetical protein
MRPTLRLFSEADPPCECELDNAHPPVSRASPDDRSGA